jgi:hypothetical protein
LLKVPFRALFYVTKVAVEKKDFIQICIVILNYIPMKNRIKFEFLAILLIILTTISCQNNTEYKVLTQEEKVAFDVYTFLNEKWNLQIFANIRESEAKHMEAMKNLLIQNNITFQVNNEEGVFLMKNYK